MLRIIVVLLAAIGWFACGGKSSPPPQTAGSGSGSDATTPPAPAAGDKGELMLAKMREYKGQVCACKDAACVEGARDAIMKWAQEHIEELQGIKPSPEQDAQADKLDEEIDACESKFGLSESGSGSGSASGSMTSADVLAKFREIKAQLCACKDAACVEKVEKEMMEWAMKSMDQIKDLKPTPAEDAEADKIQAEMEACRAKVVPPGSKP